MKIEKANWHNEGENLSLSVPFAKVDVENRTVTGFATLDNIDRQGDIVLADASVNAFLAFRGNLREMHQQHSAVGRVVDFKVQEFYDTTTSKMYSGIFVTAYVSKGSADTWEKVLDGTLSGFSIGGLVKDAETAWDPEHQMTIKIIKEYDLIELSLVDSPANQLANVFSVIKMDGTGVLKGMAAETETTGVFWCSTPHENQIAVLSKDNESIVCSDCGKPLQSIGWVESSDTQKSEAVEGLITKFLATNSMPEIVKQAQTDNSEGGNEVAVENVEEVVSEEVVEKSVDVVDEVVEEVAEVEAVEDAVEEAAEAEVEKAADVSEVGDVVEPDFTKAMEALEKSLSDSIEKSLQGAVDSITAITTLVEETSKSFDSRFEAIAAKYDSLEKTVGELIGNVDGVQKSLDAIDESSAERKSNDLDGSKDEIKKSSWGGHFLGVRTISSE